MILKHIEDYVTYSILQLLRDGSSPWPGLDLMVKLAKENPPPGTYVPKVLPNGPAKLREPHAVLTLFKAAFCKFLPQEMRPIELEGGRNSASQTCW